MDIETAISRNNYLKRLNECGEICTEFVGVSKMLLAPVVRDGYAKVVCDADGGQMGFCITESGRRYLREGGYLNQVSRKDKRNYKRRQNTSKKADWQKIAVIVAITTLIYTIISSFLKCST